MQNEELTEEERARIRSLMAFQKVVLGIVRRWGLVVFAAFLVLLVSFSSFLWVRGSSSVKRYEAKTRLLYTPKKLSLIHI